MDLKTSGKAGILNHANLHDSDISELNSTQRMQQAEDELTRLKLLLERDEQIINELRSIRDCRWSKSLGCWHIPYYDNHLTYLSTRFNGKFQLQATQQAANNKTRPVNKVEKGTSKWVFHRPLLSK